MIKSQETLMFPEEEPGLIGSNDDDSKKHWTKARLPESML